MVTSTPGKTAPLGSFTEPLTEAVVCADATTQLNTKISNPVSAFLHTRSKKCFVLSLRSFWSFIFPSTLKRKNVTGFARNFLVCRQIVIEFSYVYGLKRGATITNQFRSVK